MLLPSEVPRYDSSKETYGEYLCKCSRMSLKSHSKAEEMAVCKTPGCSRDSFNGKPAEACCRLCLKTKGESHDKVCWNKFRKSEEIRAWKLKRLPWTDVISEQGYKSSEERMFSINPVERLPLCKIPPQVRLSADDRLAMLKAPSSDRTLVEHNEVLFRLENDKTGGPRMCDVCNNRVCIIHCACCEVPVQTCGACCLLRHVERRYQRHEPDEQTEEFRAVLEFVDEPWEKICPIKGGVECRSDIVLVTLYDGLAAARRSLQLLGISPGKHMHVDPSPESRDIVQEAWPETKVVDPHTLEEWEVEEFVADPSLKRGLLVSNVITGRLCSEDRDRKRQREGSLVPVRSRDRASELAYFLKLVKDANPSIEWHVVFAEKFPLSAQERSDVYKQLQPVQSGLSGPYRFDAREFGVIQHQRNYWTTWRPCGAELKHTHVQTFEPAGSAKGSKLPPKIDEGRSFVELRYNLEFRDEEYGRNVDANRFLDENCVKRVTNVPFPPAAPIGAEGDWNYQEDYPSKFYRFAPCDMEHADSAYEKWKAAGQILPLCHYEDEGLVVEGVRKGALGARATAFGGKDLVQRPPNPDEIGQMHGYPKGFTRKYSDSISSSLVARSLHVVVLTYLLASWHMVTVEGVSLFWPDGRPREPEITVDSIWCGLGYGGLLSASCNMVDSDVAVRRNSSGPSTRTPRASTESYDWLSDSGEEWVHVMAESNEPPDVKDPGVHVCAQQGDERITVVTPPEEVYDDGEERIMHLVQDEEMVADIHQCVLPPDEYYEAMRKLWDEWWPECNPALKDHMLSVMIAFDTATAFAMSFGIAKFALAQEEAKLVGEIVGKYGRSPNPAIVRAVKNWPPIYTLKQLQEFLGTMNYIRPHCGPEYSRVSAPLRSLLKPSAVFPPNEEQKKAIEAMKELAVEFHKLCVPDEAAAIEAANAWLTGSPPAGRPYECGADTSGYAIGGICGQCDKDNGKLLPLLYICAHLADHQTNWHSSEQELWGLLHVVREKNKQLGRIPHVTHTDHANLARMDSMDLTRIDPKHFRWYQEITEGGSLLLHRPGVSAQNKGPDGISRNPEGRDALILAKSDYWDGFRARIQGIKKEILEGRAGDEEGEALTVEKVEKTDPEKLKPFPHDKGLAVSLKYEQRSQEHKFKKPARGEPIGGEQATTRKSVDSGPGDRRDQKAVASDLGDQRKSDSGQSRSTSGEGTIGGTSIPVRKSTTYSLPKQKKEYPNQEFIFDKPGERMRLDVSEHPKLGPIMDRLDKATRKAMEDSVARCPSLKNDFIKMKVWGNPEAGPVSSDRWRKKPAPSRDTVRAVVEEIAEILADRPRGADVATVPVKMPRTLVKVLYVAPFVLDEEVQRRASRWREVLESQYPIKVDLVVAEPPFETDDLLCKGYWVNVTHRDPAKRMKELRSVLSGSLLHLIGQVNKHRPRMLLGEGQGGIVVAVATFPMILERACRERAPTEQQMKEGRVAWSGVAAALVVDPVVIPTTNNGSLAPFELLKKAFPNLGVSQPVLFPRAMHLTSGYHNLPLADQLSDFMKCSPERGTFPELSFLEDAMRPPPIYFENEEGASKGVCCVCYRKGVLGRCPNVECGLLMHYSCVGVSPKHGGPWCPICRDESDLRRLESDEKDEADGDRRVPFWHEAQLGAAKKRLIKPVTSPENAFAEFPDSRWPTEEEAKYHGYESREDWYVSSRRKRSIADSAKDIQAEINQFKTDFASRRAMHVEEDEEVEVHDRSSKAEAVMTMNPPQPKLGDMISGPALADPGELIEGFSPMSWKRFKEGPSIRQELSDALQQKWEQSASGPPNALPEMLAGTEREFRQKLRSAQESCPESKQMLEKVKAALTGARSKGDAKQIGDNPDYRLNPQDGVLERRIVMSQAIIWVPVMPSASIPPEFLAAESRDVTWRRYAFERAHHTPLEPHRPHGPTWQALKRMAFWNSMNRDFTEWLNDCAICQQYRTTGVVAPMRSTVASIPEVKKLPWTDVIIDCQGPFTKSAKGNCYTVSYHCTSLGVCKIEPFERLRKADFLTALVACVMRARRVPNIVRTDRGPEMVSAVMQEFLSLCNAQQFLGAAFTPRHQGPGERKHQVVMTYWLLLMNKICRAFPQEWDLLAPVVEYLVDTEIGECGFSAHELQTGYSLLQTTDVTLAPFMQPRGLAQTELVAKLFTNFRELASILNRHKESKLMKQVENANASRHLRQLTPGEVVFRRMPPKARPPKHLLGEPSKGPYVVVRQATFSSVVLRDPATGELVDEGANIPLEQILVGPRRSLLKFETQDDKRSVGDMLSSPDNKPLPPVVKAAGWKLSKKVGWNDLRRGQVIAYQTDESRELSVAYVIRNDKDELKVECHSCRSVWKGTGIHHSKEYHAVDEDGAEIVLTPTESAVKIIVPYANIVKLVELYVEGRMMQGDASALSKGGWTFRVESRERVRAISEAMVLSRMEDEEPVAFTERDKVMWLADYLVRDQENYQVMTPDVLNKIVAVPLKERRRLLFKEKSKDATPPKVPVADPRTRSLSGPSALVPHPSDGPGEVKNVSNSLTSVQRKKMKSKEKDVSQPASLKSEILDEALAQKKRDALLRAGVPESRQKASEKAWMKKLEAKDYSGPTLDSSRYLVMRDSTIEGNPRQTEQYRKMCRDAVGLGEKPDKERYRHLEDADFDVIRWVVSRGSGCMWLPNTPRTTVKGFLHRLITRGSPVTVSYTHLTLPTKRIV